RSRDLRPGVPSPAPAWAVHDDALGAEDDRHAAPLGGAARSGRRRAGAPLRDAPRRPAPDRRRLAELPAVNDDTAAAAEGAGCQLGHHERFVGARWIGRQAEGARPEDVSDDRVRMEVRIYTA